MKPHGSVLSYSDQRATELYDAYKRALPKCRRANGTIDGDAAVAAAIVTPCSRYWVSEGVAYQNIKRIKDDPSVLDGLYPQKRLLYQSLYDTYLRLRSDPANAGLTDEQVAYLASDSPAPSFYLCMSRAKSIIRNERRRRRTM